MSTNFTEFTAGQRAIESAAASELDMVLVLVNMDAVLPLSSNADVAGLTPCSTAGV